MMNEQTNTHKAVNSLQEQSMQMSQNDGNMDSESAAM